MLKVTRGRAPTARRTAMPLRRDESGSTLISVLVLMLVLTMVGVTMTALVATTTRSVVSSRDVVNSQQAADAGLADMVAAARRGGVDCHAVAQSATAPLYTGQATCGPTAGQVTFQVTGASGTARTVTKAVYTYTTGKTTGNVTGALVSAQLSGGAINISSIYIRNSGDFVIGTGNLDCNNTTIVSGDLVMAHGSVSLSNTCSIQGDLHATGDVQINNDNLIGGNIVTLGNFGLNAGTINGSVDAVKNVTVTNGKIVGNLTSTGTGSANIYQGGIGGSLKIAGTFGQLQDSTVGSNVLASGPGSNAIAPTTTIGGNLLLKGSLSTWGSGPAVTGTKTVNAASVAAPTIALPSDLQASAFSWVDYAYNSSAFGSYRTLVLSSSQCNFQGNAALVSLITSLGTPTVVDARACSTVNLYNVTFAVKTDVVLLANQINSGQGLTLNSADGQPHQFNLLIPDNTANGSPTCAAGQGIMKLDDVHMSSLITGLAYSPCEIHLGQSGGTTNVRWNGQIYAGQLTWGGNGGTAENGFQLYYLPVVMPALNLPGGTVVTSGDGVLGDLLDRRDG